MAGGSEEWPYTAGRKGLNRVRVYDRDDSGCIQIEWYDDRGRIQRSLRSVVGEPVTDRDLARDIADRLAEAQKRKRNARAEEEVFGPGTRAIERLFTRYHRANEGGWSERYTKNQKRYRDFWLDKLGAGSGVLKVVDNPENVASILDSEAEEKGWSERTRADYLRYLRNAMAYARKIEWLEDVHGLEGL